MAYDKVDNFTSYTPLGPVTLQEGFSGRLASAGPSPSGDTHSFVYDDNGSMTIITKKDPQNQVLNERTIAYDFENRLKSVNQGAVIFEYDFSGMRVKKVSGASH